MIIRARLVKESKTEFGDLLCLSELQLDLILKQR